MIALKPNECRVLGALIEKAQTTPGQYPLTLNALNAACNQKNNRDPVLELDEDAVLSAVDGLKAKGLAREAIMSGSRVNKFKHAVRDVLQIGVAEMAVLAELLLRGPQSAGELRGRAERMVPPGTTPGLGSVEDAQSVLDALRSRPEPMVKRLERRPGERAERWVQLLCPDLHPLDAPPAHDGHPSRHDHADPAIAERLAALEALVAVLQQRVELLEAR